MLFDLVGAGGSDLDAYDPAKYDSLHGYADDVLEILEALDLHDVVYVGHSVAARRSASSPRPRDAVTIRCARARRPLPRYLDDEDYRGGFARADIDGLLDALDANYLGWSADDGAR